MVLCHLVGTSSGGAVNPNVPVLASPCRVFPDPTSTPSLLGRGWLLRLGWRYTWNSAGDTLLGSGSHLPCLPPPGLNDCECLSKALGSSIPVTAVTVPPPGLPHLPLNPAPLARGRVGRGEREDDNAVPGVPSTKGEGKERCSPPPPQTLFLIATA